MKTERGFVYFMAGADASAMAELEVNGAELNRNERSTRRGNTLSPDAQDWASKYEEADDGNAYRRASKGA